MNMSNGFRRDLEHQLIELCGEIHEKLRTDGLISDISGAHDRLELLSKNSLKRFNDFLLTARRFYHEAGAFSMYLEELKSAIENRRYSFECEKYYSIRNDEAKEVK